MPCTQHTDALTRYASGDTIEPSLAVHLETCPDCVAYLDAERRTLAMVDAELRGALSIEPPPHLATRLHARVTSAPPPSMRRWWVPALGVAAVLALVVWTSIRWSAAPASETTRVADAGVPPSGVSSEPSGSGSRPVRTPDAPAVEAPISVKPVDHRSVTSVSGLPAKSVEPEVLVPSDQRLAIRQLMASLREGRIDGAALSAPATDATTMALAPLDLQITPLTIDLLSVVAPDEATPPRSTPPEAAASQID